MIAGLINQFPNAVKQLHIKDVNRMAPATPPAAARPAGRQPPRTRSPVAFGTGEIDYGPIFTPRAKGRVQYYHQEQDGGSLDRRRAPA